MAADTGMCILLRKARVKPWRQTPAVLRHHSREPDVALCMRVLIPIDQRRRLCAPGEQFHEMILKLAAQDDSEPEVFRSMPDNVTPRILYERQGLHGQTQYHCWITEPTIPLDEFARDPAADKEQCTLGAFICVLRAAMRGLRLSDSAFFNFGVRCRDGAVVIIDAGS